MIHIGIDPGLRGAIAFVNSEHIHARALVFDLPHHPTEHRLDGYALAALMRKHAPASESARVYVEKLHAVANHSGGGAGMQQMGAMMKSVGIILGAVDCTRFPLLEVTPQTWKKRFALSADKAACLDRARQLYPEVQSSLARVKDHNRGEALLIAHWGLICMTTDDEVPF